MSFYSNRAPGFTLIELVIVIIIIGIVAAAVSPIVGHSFSAYTASSRRATLVQEAQSVMQSLERDLYYAVPGSVAVEVNPDLGATPPRPPRVSLLSLAEHTNPARLPSGRYTAELTLADPVTDLRVLGCLNNQAGQHVVIGSSGDLLSDYADALQVAHASGPVSRALENDFTNDCTAADPEATVTLPGSHTFDPTGAGSAFNRLYLTQGQVNLECVPPEFRRYSGTLNAPGTARLLSHRVVSCGLTFIPGTTNTPPALQAVIELGDEDGEQVRLVRIFQLVNAP